MSARDHHHHDDDDNSSDPRKMKDSTLPPLPGTRFPNATHAARLPQPSTTVIPSCSTAEEAKVHPASSTSMPPPPPPVAPPPSPCSIVSLSLPSSRTLPLPKKIPKKPRRKGFGLADWNKLVARSKDLALLHGESPLHRKLRWREIRQHTSMHDGWIVLRNKVYFIAPYLAYHPGGEVILTSVLGKDVSTLYDKYHPWISEESLIGKLHIGYLDTSPDPDEKESDDDDDDNKSDAGGDSRSYLPSSINNP